MSDLPPVRRSIVVPLDRASAFDLFTRRLPEWWPLEHRSVTAGALSCHVEPRLGGRLYERTQAGGEAPWGAFTVWEEPDRVVFHWHPGVPEAAATEVEVTFTPVGDATRVDLEHRGWERLGARASFVRAAFEGGWPGVLERFGALAASREAPPWASTPGCLTRS